MRSVHVLVNWQPIAPELYPRITAVDPRVRLLQGASLAPESPEYRRMLTRADVIFGEYRPRGLEGLAQGLGWLQYVGAGVEWYAGSGLAERGIQVTTASGVGGRSIAEHVITGILMLLKSAPERLEAQHTHRWQKVRVQELGDATVLVIGLGGIGRAVAELAGAFGARVLAVRRDPSAPRPPAVAAVYPQSALGALLPNVDVVVVCAALTPETRYLIGAAELAAMKQTAILINVARGVLVNESALVNALARQDIGGAVLDVFETEPLSPHSLLWDLPNVLISAHDSVDLDRYYEKLVAFFCAQLRRYLAGESLLNLVDPRRGY